VTSPKTTLDADTVAKIDGITQMLLAQLEVQTWAALVLLEGAPPERRDAFLAQLAELRGRLVRVRRGLVGTSRPALVGRREAGQ
jgi:hypothetical protein